MCRPARVPGTWGQQRPNKNTRVNHVVTGGVTGAASPRSHTLTPRSRPVAQSDRGRLARTGGQLARTSPPVAVLLLPLPVKLFVSRTTLRLACLGLGRGRRRWSLAVSDRNMRLEQVGRDRNLAVRTDCSFHRWPSVDDAEQVLRSCDGPSYSQPISLTSAAPHSPQATRSSSPAANPHE